MEIEYVTHASLFLRTEKTSLLTDPFFFFDSLTASCWLHYPPSPQPLTPEHFGKINYVYCSHIHEDHCHRETLSVLKDRIETILIPAAKSDLESRLLELDFKNIVTLPNEESVSLPGDIVVTSFHDPNRVDTALLVEMDGKTVLHGNDCRLNPAIFHRMAKRFSIDYAFILTTSVQDLYPCLLPLPVKRLWELREEEEKKVLDYTFHFLEILKPKVTIPYACTLVLMDPEQLFLNGLGRSTPPLFKKEFEKRLPHQECWMMQPGDKIDTRKGNLLSAHAENEWGESVDELIDNLSCYLKNNFPVHVPFDLGELSTVIEPLQLYFKNRLAYPFPQELENQVIRFQIRHRQGIEFFFLDLKTKKFERGKGKKPLIEITLPASMIPLLLAKQHNPYTLLFAYRISFQIHIKKKLPPAVENAFYVVTFIALFDYALYLQIHNTSAARSMINIELKPNLLG